MTGRIWAFAIYSICYELIIWGTFAYGVFYKGYSGLWFVVAVLMSINQLKANSFGIIKNQE